MLSIIGAVYEASDGDQLSPPPHRQKPLSTADMTVQATIPPYAGNLAQQHDDTTDLSTQTATLKINDMDNNKIADSHDMRASTATAQVPPTMSDSSPHTLIINGVKYVKEEPKVNISARMSVPSPSQDKTSGQSIHNTKDFTAGYLPIVHQAELGNPNPTTADPFNLQPVPGAAAAGLGPASADTSSTRASGGPSTGRVIRNYNEYVNPVSSAGHADNRDSELDSTRIKVLFDDGPSLAVQKDVLLRFLGKHAKMFEGIMSQQTFRLTPTSIWAFGYLSCCIERRAKGSQQALKLSKLSNGRLVDLYLTAKHFDHDWILVPCLQAIDPRVDFREYVDDLKRVYDSGEADETFRAYFKNRFAVCMLLHELPVSMPPRCSDALATTLGVDGTIASDIKLAVMEETAAGAEPKPTSSWSYDIDLDASIDRTEASVSDGNGGWDIGPSGWSDPQEPTAMPKTKAASTKTGFVETAPSSEFGADAWGRGDDRSYADWEQPASNRRLATPLNDVHRASQSMHNVIESGGPAYANNWGWDGIQASSERMEVASASAVANDGWTVNENTQGDTWGASTDQQFVPRNIADEWDTAPRWVSHRARSIPHPAQEAAFYPQRQLQGPAPSSSSATPPPSRRALPTPFAASAPARVPDLPFHASTPVHFGGFAHTAYDIPPIGMPNYVHPFGYARQAHVGNGIMHPTAPGLYGLAGSIMYTIRASDGIFTNLYFQAGEKITNVVSYVHTLSLTHPNYSQVRSDTHMGSPSSGYMLKGICRGRHGFFHESFVHDRYPAMPPQTPFHTQLASPFAPPRVADAVDVNENNDSHWGSGVDKKGKGRANDKQAHVSEGEVSDDGADEWGGGPAEPRNDGWGRHAANNNGWGRDKAPDSGEDDWNPAAPQGW